MQRILLILLVVASTNAWGWNAAGHRIVAAIAWRQLSPAAQDAAARLLARHPDHRNWMARADADSAYTAFLEASTWPDDIRRDPRFYDPGDEPPTPHLPGFPDMDRHKAWHYVDIRPDGSRREGELDHQIDRLAKLLADPRTPAADKAYALPWLLHLVADGHQPLHVGSHDDEGGNRVEITDPFNPRLPTTNLHAWWDDLPGPPWLRGKRLETVVAALLASHHAPEQDDVAGWLRESREISRAAAYPAAGDGPIPAVTADFRGQARNLANRRLAEAGYRLGHLLDACLAEVSRGTDGPARPPRIK